MLRNIEFAPNLGELAKKNGKNLFFLEKFLVRKVEKSLTNQAAKVKIGKLGG
jgi:hypothetical protein